MTPILPCPFCGIDPHVSGEYDLAGETYVYVTCRGPDEAPHEVVQLRNDEWNRRTTSKHLLLEYIKQASELGYLPPKVNVDLLNLASRMGN